MHSGNEAVGSILTYDVMENLAAAAYDDLKVLTCDIAQRSVGSVGNLQATAYVRQQLLDYGWEVQTQRFDAFHWTVEGVTLEQADNAFEALPSPYTLACDLTGNLVTASSMDDLNSIDAREKILVIRGELTGEPLMPKNFVFYNPESHRRLVSKLEQSSALAVICVVDENAPHAGGEYPFPVIEDGDFTLPSVYMTEKEGDRLLARPELPVHLTIRAHREASRGYNVLGRKGQGSGGHITVTAHIDAKQGSPGAIDNATGVVTLLLLARLMAGHDGMPPVELIALNGEDFYSVPGQMSYLEECRAGMSDHLLNVNIDGVGYQEGRTSISLFNLPASLVKRVEEMLAAYDGLVEGKPWYQGDHSIFLQHGVPALAISSEWLIDNLETQRITHTARDSMDTVDPEKLVQLAEALSGLVRRCK
jgi:aminopeptidase YwaD